MAEELGLEERDLEPYGRYKAKVGLEPMRRRKGAGGRLLLVSGITPTPPGEGKTTVSVGLADGLRLLGRRAVLCLREPSLGPIFGRKGGATGGGRTQVVPREEINLHFTGDFHAIASAHSLLSAMLDNRLHWGNDLGLDPRRITWRRVLDMNDRALRSIVIGLGGRGSGVPREDAFMITAASELMAIFCLSEDLADLASRIDRIIVGYRCNGSAVRAEALGAAGAMTMLLKDALLPNLVQTAEGTPAFVHGGPFANIAHGCNSLIATRMALTLGDVVVTEAGFGTELGAEKFFDIKCRFGELEPNGVVIVATVRALKWHGRATDPTREDVPAVHRGLPNLAKHVENIRRFGLPCVVAVNRFEADTEAELRAVTDGCDALCVPSARAEGFARGAEGMRSLAARVDCMLEEEGTTFAPLYGVGLPLEEKMDVIAREMYGADGVDLAPSARTDLESLEAAGLSEAPVCMAKTPFSLTDDPAQRGRPRGFRIRVKGLTPSAGAGFVIARTGDVLVMPGLPARPAAEGMRVDADGRVLGLV